MPFPSHSLFSNLQHGAEPHAEKRDKEGSEGKPQAYRIVLRQSRIMPDVF